jgi:rhodanese-related sulfurtransferase
MKPSILKLFVLMLAAVLAIAGCGGNQVAQQAAPAAAAINLQELPADIDTSTVDSLRNRDDVVILDVREDWEYAEGHIPGAVLLPLGSIPDRLSEIPQDKTVVAVCRSGNRSGQATQFLRQQGFENVHNMEGGMIAWGEAGLPVDR